MKNYESLTLKQLQIEGKKITKELAFETLLAQKQNRTVDYEAILFKLKIIENILQKRVNEPVRCSLPKKIQRKIGILKKLDVI